MSHRRTFKIGRGIGKWRRQTTKFQKAQREKSKFWNDKKRKMHPKRNIIAAANMDFECLTDLGETEDWMSQKYNK